MNEIEKKNWLNKRIANLIVGEQYFHHHAYEIINTHDYLKNDLLQSLQNEIIIKPRIKKTGKIFSPAIEAKILNVELRRILNQELKSDIKLEVFEEKGVFYFSQDKGSIGGFDFAILNHERNIIALRNLCFGELHYHEGEKRWSDFIKRNPDLRKIALKNENKQLIGHDLLTDTNEKNSPLVVGEIQFGNWALAYRDFFKVLKANVQNSIDCLIYIVPTNNLESMLSDGIVTFDNTVQIIKQFEKVISVPVWVIGLDLQI